MYVSDLLIINVREYMLIISFKLTVIQTKITRLRVDKNMRCHKQAPIYIACIQTSKTSPFIQNVLFTPGK